MFTITQEDIESITDQEALRGTDRFLPPKEEIPNEFWGMFKGFPNNIYFRIVEQIYVNEPPPAGIVVINPGFTGVGMKRFLAAHVILMEPEYQHRIAGMSYLLSKIATIQEVKNEPSDRKGNE